MSQLSAHINGCSPKSRKTEKFAGLTTVFATRIAKKNVPDGNSIGKMVEKKNIQVLSIKLSKTPG